MTINISQHYQKHIKNLNQNHFIYKVRKAFYLLTRQEEKLYEVGFNEGFKFAADLLQKNKPIVDSNKKIIGVVYKNANFKIANEIVDKVCKKYFINKQSLFGKDRHQEVVRVRSILHNLLHEKYKVSISSIGRFFNQDHTTVQHSLNNKLNKKRYWGEEQTIWEEYSKLKEEFTTTE